MDSVSNRHPRATAAVLVAAVALLAGAPRVTAATWESKEHNVILRTPGEPAPWAWVTVAPEWAAQGVIRQAERRLTKRADGTPTEGEGAVLHLAKRAAPDGQTLAQAVERPAVRDFLLKRFRGTAKDVKVEPTTIASSTNPEGHPARVLRAKGTALNLRGKEGTCTGVLVVALAKGHLYLLRMYAFPTQGDPEALLNDVSTMEADEDGLELIDTQEPKAPAPLPDAAGDEPEPGKAVVIENRAQGWRLVKHAGLKAIEPTAEDRAQDIVWRLTATDPAGGYSLWLQAVPHDRSVDGRKATPPDLRAWITHAWWQEFSGAHSRGDIHTFKWPRKTARPTFLTLPDVDDADVRVGVVTGRRRRPTEVDARAMLKSLKCVEKPKVDKIGKRSNTNQALRGILRGNRDRGGIETEARFVWRTPAHSYRLQVLLWGNGFTRFGTAIRETLESMEFGAKFK